MTYLYVWLAFNAAVSLFLWIAPPICQAAARRLR